MADLFAPVTLGPLLRLPTTTELVPDLRQDDVGVAVALSTASSAVVATPQSDLSALELVLEMSLIFL